MRSLSDVSLAIKPTGTHVLLNVHYGASGISETVALSGDEAAHLAAWLLMLGGLTGSTDAEVSRLAEKLRDKFNDLLDAIRILTPDEQTDAESSCLVCSKVIHNKANMQRHVQTHGRQDGTETVD